MSLNVGEIITIPSPIDVHVHLREPGGEAKETIESGTLAAIAGGYQAVFDMPNNPNGNETRTVDRVQQKIYIARKDAHTKIGFYGGVDMENPAVEEFPGMVLIVAGLKLYMGPTTGNIKIYDLGVARPAIDSWMGTAREAGKTPPILLHAIDEIGAETAEYIASKGYKVHWCHLSSAYEAEASRKLTKKYPEFFTSGTTIHHMTMTERNADFQQGWHGARMQPTLKKEYDAEAILYAYNKSDIKIIETDHAPHTEEDKLKAEAENPEGHTEADCTTCYGISGIEFAIPVLASLVKRRKITLDRMVDSLYTQPARMLGLDTSQDNSKTYLKIGPRILGEDDVVGKSRNHPYYGWTGWAKVMGVEIGDAQGKILAAGSVL